MIKKCCKNISKIIYIIKFKLFNKNLKKVHSVSSISQTEINIELDKIFDYSDDYKLRTQTNDSIYETEERSYIEIQNYSNSQYYDSGLYNRETLEKSSSELVKENTILTLKKLSSL